MSFKAPIPPPEPEISTEPPTHRRRVTYAPVILQGALVCLLLMGVQRTVGLLWPGLILTVIFIVASLVSAVQMKALCERLNDELNQTPELEAAHRLLDANMKMAYVAMIVIYPLIAASLLTGTFVVSLLLLVTSALSTPFLVSTENRFKALKTSADPLIAAQFAEYLVQMKEPRFGLSAFVPAP